MEELTKFEEYVKDLGYITNPYTIIYDYFEDINDYFVVECLDIIHAHNNEVIIKINDASSKIDKKIMAAKPIVATIVKKETKEEDVDNSYTYPHQNSIDNILESLKYYKTLEEFNNNVMSLSKEAIAIIKLHLLKELNIIASLIAHQIAKNPLANIEELKNKYSLLRSFLDELIIEQEIEAEKEQQEIEKYPETIILVPHGNTTYLYEDIQNYYESYDEILKTYENIISKKFLSSKSNAPIKDKGENLYEHKKKTGLRVLYIRKGNYIFVCSLFYKDKQRSTRITQYYDEAIRRFNKFMETNIDLENPDFIISQKELIGEIYSELESSPTISLKKEGV